MSNSEVTDLVAKIRQDIEGSHDPEATEREFRACHSCAVHSDSEELCESCSERHTAHKNTGRCRPPPAPPHGPTFQITVGNQEIGTVQNAQHRITSVEPIRAIGQDAPVDYIPGRSTGLLGTGTIQGAIDFHREYPLSALARNESIARSSMSARHFGMIYGMNPSMRERLGALRPEDTLRIRDEFLVNDPTFNEAVRRISDNMPNANGDVIHIGGGTPPPQEHTEATVAWFQSLYSLGRVTAAVLEHESIPVPEVNLNVDWDAFMNLSHAERLSRIPHGIAVNPHTLEELRHRVTESAGISLEEYLGAPIYVNNRVPEGALIAIPQAIDVRLLRPQGTPAVPTGEIPTGMNPTGEIPIGPPEPMLDLTAPVDFSQTPRPDQQPLTRQQMETLREAIFETFWEDTFPQTTLPTWESVLTDTSVADRMRLLDALEDIRMNPVRDFNAPEHIRSIMQRGFYFVLAEMEQELLKSIEGRLVQSLNAISPMMGTERRTSFPVGLRDYLTRRPHQREAWEKLHGPIPDLPDRYMRVSEDEDEIL